MRIIIQAWALGLLLAGCAPNRQLHDAYVGKNPANAATQVLPTHHHAVIRGYVPRKPKAPVPWVPGEAQDKPKAQP